MIPIAHVLRSPRSAKLLPLLHCAKANLTQLSLWATSGLTGPIPPELGLGGLANPTRLYVNDKDLTEPIPDSSIDLDDPPRLHFGGQQRPVRARSLLSHRRVSVAGRGCHAQALRPASPTVRAFSYGGKESRTLSLPSKGDLSMSTTRPSPSRQHGPTRRAPTSAAEQVTAARRLTLAVLALLVTVAAPLDAQGPVHQGERVRALTTNGAQFVGVVTEIDAESLRLLPDGGTVPLNLPLAEIQGLERSIGQGHHGRKWGTYGAIAGGGIGVLSGLTWWGRGEGRNQAATVVYLGAVNAIWMGGAGYAAGYFLGKYDTWQTVQLRRSAQRSFGLFVESVPAAGNARSFYVLVGVAIPWG